MSDRIIRENIAHLTEQLASETSALKRQQLARRIKKEIERFAPSDCRAAAPRDQIEEYWKSRAERTRQRARRHRDEGLRDHLLKIATGYDELAERARAAREATETQGGET
jgi:hypothetical protein